MAWSTVSGETERAVRIMAPERIWRSPAGAFNPCSSMRASASMSSSGRLATISTTASRSRFRPICWRRSFSQSLSRAVGETTFTTSGLTPTISFPRRSMDAPTRHRAEHQTGRRPRPLYVTGAPHRGHPERLRRIADHLSHAKLLVGPVLYFILTKWRAHARGV